MSATPWNLTVQTASAGDAILQQGANPALRLIQLVRSTCHAISGRGLVDRAQAPPPPRPTHLPSGIIIT